MQPEAILLVEDEPILRRIVCESLEDDGFRVTTAPDADTAWAMVDGGLTFDILVTDVRMPGQMNGLDLALRVNERYPDIRIIVVSGFTLLTDFDQRLMRFLRKPFTSAKLTATILSNNGSSG